jgi:hypothetical protein
MDLRTTKTADKIRTNEKKAVARALAGRLTGGHFNVSIEEGRASTVRRSA